MKITTRTACWGIELKNDTVTEDISSQQELRETMINFLEAVKDMSYVLDLHNNYKEEIFELTEKVINRLEEI